MSTPFLKLSSLVLLGAAATFGISCAPQPKIKVYPVNVLVERDADVPFPGIQLEVGRQVLAQTDAAGAAQLELRGFEGATVPLNVRCPKDHEQLQPLSIRLLSLAQGTAPTLHATCIRKARQLAVVVRAARGSDLPIVHHSKTLARTDSDGVAHVLLEGAPGDSIELTLDTAGQPDLRPKSPAAFFTISAEDSVTSYDTEFAVKPPPVVVRRARPKAPTGPIRIQ